MSRDSYRTSPARDKLRDMGEEVLRPGAYESVIPQQLLHLLKQLPEPATSSCPIDTGDSADRRALPLQATDHLEETTQGGPEPR